MKRCPPCKRAHKLRKRCVEVCLALTMGCSGNGRGDVSAKSLAAGSVEKVQVFYERVDRSELEGIWAGRELIRFETDNRLTLLALGEPRPLAGTPSSAQTITAGVVRLPDSAGGAWLCVGAGSYFTQ